MGWWWVDGRGAGWVGAGRSWNVICLVDELQVLRTKCLKQKPRFEPSAISRSVKLYS